MAPHCPGGPSWSWEPVQAGLSQLWSWTETLRKGGEELWEGERGHEVEGRWQNILPRGLQDRPHRHPGFRPGRPCWASGLQNCDLIILCWFKPQCLVICYRSNKKLIQFWKRSALPLEWPNPSPSNGVPHRELLLPISHVGAKRSVHLHSSLICSAWSNLSQGS